MDKAIAYPPKRSSGTLVLAKIVDTLRFIHPTELFLYQCGQLSRGAACEFAGIDIYTFMAACKQYKIPMINNSLEELETDLARFKSKNR